MVSMVCAKETALALVIVSKDVIRNGDVGVGKEFSILCLVYYYLGSYLV